MCDAVVRYRAVAVESGNAIGKDFWIAGIMLWWLFTRHNSLVIVTGPSQTVLGSVTSKEVRRALYGSDMLRDEAKISDGIRSSPQTVTIAPGWQALAYSTTNVERSSGQHAEHLLAVIEEASGVDRPAWDAISSLKPTKIVAIGNPLRPDGGFADMVEEAAEDRRRGVPDREVTHAINIPSTESPHAQLDQSPFGLADRTWLDAMARKYGVDSLWYRTHVLAIRPKESHETLIKLEHLDYATRAEHARTVMYLRLTQPTPRRIGCDLGVGVGRDRTVIVVRDDYGILRLESSNQLDEDGAAQRIAHLMNELKVDACRVTYDAAGACGKIMRGRLQKYGVVGAVPYFGAKSGRRRAANLRIASALLLAVRLDPGHTIIPNQPQHPFYIPNDKWWPDLREELAQLRYDLAGDRTRLESKADFMDRLGHSPDLADALIQTFSQISP
jgi:hypothetical protein